MAARRRKATTKRHDTSKRCNAATKRCKLASGTVASPSVSVPQFRMCWGLFTCLCPRAHSHPHPWQGLSVSDTDGSQHDKWPWKWISAFFYYNHYRTPKHTVAISPSSGFHYSLAFPLLFWQAPFVALDVMRDAPFLHRTYSAAALGCPLRRAAS